MSGRVPSRKVMERAYVTDRVRHTKLTAGQAREEFKAGIAVIEREAADHWEDQSLPTRTAQEVIMRLTRMGFSEEEVARLISQVLVLGQLGCVSTEHLSELVRRIFKEG